MEVIVIHREMLTEANNAHLSLLTFVVRIHNVSTSKTSISGIKDVSRKINLSFSSMSSPFATRPESSLIRGFITKSGISMSYYLLGTCVLQTNKPTS